MKIALFSAFYPYRGGIAQFSAMLYRALEKEHTVNAFTFKRQYPGFLFPGSSQYVSDDDSADSIEALRVLDSVNPVTFTTAAKKINETHPRLYIGQYWMTFFGPAMAGMQKRITKSAKRISILHNVIPHEKRFFDKKANRMFLKQNDGFVVLSDVVLRDLLSLKPDAKYLRIDHPIYNQFGEGLNRAEALTKLGLDSSNNYLLFFGFIRDYKGLDLLIEALVDLPSDTHVIVAGEVYGSFEKYQKTIDSLGLNARIHLFTEYISDSEVSTYFSASDVCMLPYKGATQSGITAISHHFNLPIIATDVGGLKENTRHDETGLVVSQPDSKLIAEAVDHYFTAKLKLSFSKNIEAEKSENSWENFAQKIVEFSHSL
ncbi:MAG: glycosyltransferase involved in cell wall biosynthesis [Flavobacteriaceae bacterium]|jgi:glycosyltransferase involved in cell wall biosynthesis